MKLCKVFMLVLSCCSVGCWGSSTPWDYDNSGSHGPDNWATDFPLCGGTYQSPVNIDRYISRYRRFRDMHFNHYHHHATQATVSNNGHAMMVEMEFDGTIPYITGGRLKGKYEFLQFHMHWGGDNLRGSEHTINGVRYPMEMHLVHWKKSYGTVEEALTHRNGLAVLGFMFVLSTNTNPAIDGLLALVGDIEDADTNTVTTDVYPLTSLFPRDLSRFYRYDGSLTTPTCNEAVVWTVYDEPLTISQDQIDALRSLKNTAGDDLVNNYRPIQALNGRKVVKSFRR